MATRSGHPVNLSAHWPARSKKPQAALRLSGGLRPPRRCGPRPQDARSASDSDAGEEGRSALPAPPLDRFDRACSVHRNGGRTARGPLWPLLAVTVTGAPVLIVRTRPVLTTIHRA